MEQWANPNAAQNQPQQQQQQQQHLPPWYRAAGSQPSHNSSWQGQPSLGAPAVRPPQPPGYGPPSQWGGASNGSSSSSSTGYSTHSAGSNGWRSNSPSPYQRPYAPGGSSYAGGPRFGGGSGGPGGYSAGGRGYGGGSSGRGGYGRGRGSPSPQRAPSPPVWVKEDCWLLPKPGSVEAAAHAAAVARHRTQQRQQQQQQQQQRNDSVTLAAGAVASDAHAVAAIAAAAQSGVIDLTADEGISAAAPGAAGPPSQAAVIDLTGQTAVPSPTTAVSQQLSGLELLLQQHRQQPQPQQAPSAPAPPPRVVYIMRGLPGSGKSTRAAQIAAEARAAAGSNSSSSSAGAADPVAIHSTDSYFCDPVSGVYVFNPELLSTNHQRNFDAFCASLAAGVGTVIVDNTNLQPWQYEKYVQQAWAAGYRVREEVVGEFTAEAVALYAQRNVHGVPLDKIHIMLEQWQRQ